MKDKIEEILAKYGYDEISFDDECEWFIFLKMIDEIRNIE